MGFRATLCSEQYEIDWPEWFVNKYESSLHILNGLTSKRECKTYTTWLNLAEDIQKAIDWEKFRVGSFVYVYLHECGGITRVQVMKDKILLTEPIAWKVVKEETHWYCYGCSDAQEADATALARA